LRVFISRFLSDETGATAIEYALIASLVSVFIIGAVATLGQTIKTTLYDRISAAFP
jgi:pilus assembly protein Flp/PilA